MFFPYALFAHLVTVAVLFAGLGIEAVLLPAMRSAPTLSVLRALLRVGSVLQWLFPIATIALVVTGAILAAIERRGWHDGWLVVSAGLMVVLALVGPLLTGRRMARLAAAAFRAPGDAVDAVTDACRRDPILGAASTFIAAESVVLLMLMVLKPAVPVALALVAVAVAATLASARREAPAAVRKSSAI